MPLKKLQKEWDEKFEKFLSFGEFSCENGQSCEVKASELKSYLLSRDKALLEAVVGMCEKKKYPSKERGSKDFPYTQFTKANNTKEAILMFGYNKALSYLSAEIKKEL